ncbi:MAG: sensor histidine kinase [Bacteroidetes bacterium]|nr:MAG: sensor histidine kinase [Bacteroidota bacterium]
MRTHFKLLLLFVLWANTALGSPDSSYVQAKLSRIDSLLHQDPTGFRTELDRLASELEAKKADKVLRGRVAIRQGISYYYLGTYDTCETYIGYAIDVLRGSVYKSELAKAIRIKGVLFMMDDDYANAWDQFNESLSIYEALNDTIGIGDNNLSIGIINQHRGHFENALNHYSKAEQYYRAKGLEIKLGPIYNNVGSVYNNQKNYDSAIVYLKKSVGISLKFNNLTSLQNAYHNLGTNFSSLNQSDSAIHYYELAVGLSQHDIFNLAPTLVVLGHEYQKKGLYSTAMQHYNEAIKLSEPNHFFVPLKEAHFNISEIAIVKGDYRTALDHYQKFTAYSDSQSANIFSGRLAELETLYETEKKEAEIQSLKTLQSEQEATLKLRKKFNYGLAIAVIVLIVFLILLVYNRKKLGASREEALVLNQSLSRKSAELEDKQELLLETMKEKDELISLLAHDIRSPFTKIISLMEVVKLEGVNGQDLESYLGLIENVSYDGLALIQDMVDLSRIQDSELIPSRAQDRRFSVNEIIKKQVQFYQSQVTAKDLKLNLNLDQDVELVNKASFFERTLDNLLSNAIKYSRKGGNIVLKSELDADFFHLYIQDEGPGFSQSDFEKVFQKFQRLSAQPTGNESSTGLGLYIAKTFTKAMRGELELISQAGEGAHFHIQLPLR